MRPKLGVSVLKDESLLDRFEVESQFMVLIRNGNLAWEIDAATGDRQGGAVAVWVHRTLDGGFTISFVLPSWKMTVGGQSQPLTFYQDVAILCNPIELEYQAFKFLFQNE